MHPLMYPESAVEAPDMKLPNIGSSSHLLKMPDIMYQVSAEEAPVMQIHPLVYLVSAEEAPDAKMPNI